VVQVDQGSEPDEFWQLMPEVEVKPQSIKGEEEEEEEDEEDANRRTTRAEVEGEGDDDDEDLVDDEGLFQDSGPKKSGRRKSIYLKKISQWELSISLVRRKKRKKKKKKDFKKIKKSLFMLQHFVGTICLLTAPLLTSFSPYPIHINM
jgi:hypothetical protein